MASPSNALPEKWRPVALPAHLREIIARARSAPDQWPCLNGKVGNNDVYRVDRAEGAYVVKIYKQDERNRAVREWSGLHIFRERGLDFTPEPHAFSPGEPDVIVMSYLPGTHLGEQNLTHAQLAALAAATQRIHAINPANTSETLGRSMDIEAYLHKLQRRFSAIDRPSLSPQHLEALHMVSDWFASGDPLTLKQRTEVVLSRGDENLANCLWHREQLRIVDLEYCGWEDRFLDLAKTTEHIQSWGTPDEKWQYFLDCFELNRDQRRRVRQAQLRLAMGWLLGILASASWLASGEFAARYARARRLYEARAD